MLHENTAQALELKQNKTTKLTKLKCYSMLELWCFLCGGKAFDRVNRKHLLVIREENDMFSQLFQSRVQCEVLLEVLLKSLRPQLQRKAVMCHQSGPGWAASRIPLRLNTSIERRGMWWQVSFSTSPWLGKSCNLPSIILLYIGITITEAPVHCLLSLSQHIIFLCSYFKLHYRKKCCTWHSLHLSCLQTF